MADVWNDVLGLAVASPLVYSRDGEPPLAQAGIEVIDSFTGLSHPALGLATPGDPLALLQAVPETETPFSLD